MREDINPGGEGKFTNFADLMKYLKMSLDRCPSGVRLKLEKKKYIQLQFIPPGSQKRQSKTCGEQLTYSGIDNAVIKAHKVNEALSRFTLASEFWEWYNSEVLGQVESVDDRRTYREIFQKIEDAYFKGRHRGSGEERSENDISNKTTFDDYYHRIFKKFPNWDNYPSWKDFETVLFSWKQGTKSFKDAYYVLKKIAGMSHNKAELLAKLNDIDPTQTIFAKKQYITWNDYLEWESTCLNTPKFKKSDEEARDAWLWVTGMIILYGLRPSEIKAGLNLTKPYEKDGLVIPAINDRNNEKLFLVIANKDIQGISTKTGYRVILPVTRSEEVIERLRIHGVNLPETNSTEKASLKSLRQQFNGNHRKWLADNNCPVTQVYAFRRLNNWLQHQYGVPKHIIAANLGHSEAVNEKHYMSWNDFRSRIDMLEGFTKEPLGYRTAVERLEGLGIDIEDPSVKLILRVIYQLD